MKTSKNKKRRRHSNFGYFVLEGLRGAFNHGFMSFAAVTIIAACLLITGSFSLVAFNIEYNLDKLMQENEFLAYVDDSLTQEEAEALQTQIEGIDNVASVTFISQAEAMASYLEGIDADDELYNSLPNSVLRHRYSITVNDIAALSETTAAVNAVSGIADISAAYAVAEGFVTVRNIVTIVTIGMIAVLLVISLFIVSNAIKLATLSRQEEIAIMKMCGATNGFIRMPFVYEGILLGVLSAGLGFLCQWGLYSLLLNAVHSSVRMQLISLISFETIGPLLGAVFGGIGLIVGVFGSLMTIRKYLQV